MRASLITFSIPLFFLAIGVELVLARRKHRRLFRLQDSINSLSCGVAQQVLGIGLIWAVVGGYAFLFEHLAIRPLDAGAWWVWVLGAIGVDLCYYWMHRGSHRVGFLWAGHVVHHQSEEFNLTTALRQSALQGALGAAFYWPLAILGLPTEVFLTLSTINTLYQFWIHTRLIGRMGPFEWIFNTPSHHRVHHGIDPKYIDKNYGGILIVWDRLFGTFQREEEEPAYGTVKPLHSWNPLWANLDSWAYMWRLSRASRRWRDKIYAFIAPPEWRPPDLGGVVVIPEVDRAARVLYERPRHRGMHGYVVLHFVPVALATVLVLAEPPPLEASLVVAWTMASLVAWGGLFERKWWAIPLEAIRLAAAPIAIAFLHPELWPWAPLAALAIALVSALALARMAPALRDAAPA